MFPSAANSRTAVPADLGVSKLAALGKRFLNQVAGFADAAAERSRFAALPRRYLDDVGMTPGERAAVLHYEEPILNPWQAIAAHNG